jgi:hypothetical protein
MKNVSRVIAAAFFALLATAEQGHAASATANASATVIAAIAVSKTADMNFGSVVPTASAGTVALSTAGAVTSTLTTTGAHSAAAFNVTGGANEAYSIALPSSASLSDGASHTMTVNTFTSSAGASSTLNGSGTSSFTVGATLQVGANQVAGAYTGTFQVTVAYN